MRELADVVPKSDEVGASRSGWGAIEGKEGEWVCMGEVDLGGVDS